MTVKVPGEYYSEDEIVDLLRKAERLGFDLDSKELDSLTIEQLDKLVNLIQ